MQRPVVLDLDGSVLPLHGSDRVDLASHQEAIRFGCSWSVLSDFERMLESRLPETHGTVLLGSGDFHHLTYLLLKRLAGADAFDLVVFDNHPDNMRYPMGIHCGSWVRWAASLACVAHVHVIGITSSDITGPHAIENNLLPLFRGRVTYWTLGSEIVWPKYFGLAHAVLRFDGPEALLRAVATYVADLDRSIYVSIDKDVLDPSSARTNWDQGVLSEAFLLAAIELFAGRIIASDITGDVSSYVYRSRMKRWLSALDGQFLPAPEVLTAWQERHREVNARLIGALAATRSPIVSKHRVAPA